MMEEIEGLDLFSGPEHEPIHWEQGEPGALLIHGFPGSPAEIRPLAQTLFNAGWSAHAPLLPGFGPDIKTLFERDHEMWIETVNAALESLAQNHHPILVVGHSMGGALALYTARDHALDGLILLAPFWKLPLDGFWLRFFSPVLHLVMPKAKPFKLLDFDRPEMRKGIREFLPEIDLDDPQVQAKIREITIPTRIFTELRRLGQKARRSAPAITSPTLILQGTKDEIVRPARTRELLVDLGGAVTYEELDGEHNLVDEHAPAWPGVTRAMRAFADAVRQKEPPLRTFRSA